MDNDDDWVTKDRHSDDEMYDHKLLKKENQKSK